MNGSVRLNCGQRLPHTFGTAQSTLRTLVSATGVVVSFPEERQDGMQIGAVVAVVVARRQTDDELIAGLPLMRHTSILPSATWPFTLREIGMSGNCA